MGDEVVNTNPDCTHKGSHGIVVSIDDLPDDAGRTATYCCTNSGDSWNANDLLTKTLDQLSPLDIVTPEDTHSTNESRHTVKRQLKNRKNNMKITEAQLRKIIREVVLEEESIVDSQDQVVLDFLTANDADGAASEIMEIVGDKVEDAAATLESFIEIAFDADIVLPRGIVDRTHRAIGKLVMQHDRTAIESSPDSAILKALGRTLAHVLGPVPQDMKRITFKPRKTGGVVTAIQIIHDSDAGRTDGMMMAPDLHGTGLTLDDVAVRLAQMGAKRAR